MRSAPFVLAVPEVSWPSAAFEAGLAARMAMPVVVRRLPSYVALLEAIDGLPADAVWAPPLVAHALFREGRAEPVAAAVRAGRAAYPSVIVCREDRRFRLGSAPPLSLAMTSPLSAAGDRVARLFLSAIGQSTRSERHVGSHAAVLSAVISGAVDIGATFGRVDGSGTRVVVPDAPRNVRLAAVAGFVPSDSVVVRRERLFDLGPALRSALASLGTAELGDLHHSAGVEGFRPTDASHLHPLLRLTSLAHAAALAQAFGGGPAVTSKP